MAAFGMCFAIHMIRPTKHTFDSLCECEMGGVQSPQINQMKTYEFDILNSITLTQTAQWNSLVDLSTHSTECGATKPPSILDQFPRLG